MKIQYFATRQQVEDVYNQGIKDAQLQQQNLLNEQQQLLNDYESQYNTRLDQYSNLMNQQQANLETWANTQKDLQQKQTDYNIGLIEQNKQEAKEATEKETQDAYVDYMKKSNQYGGTSELLAAQGLATQGFSESSKIAIYNTYQNRVSNAKTALTKANVQYDNQIQQALLNNDSALAEIALQQLQQSYQIALQGFEYKDNLYQERLGYIQDINNTYFNRNQTLQNRIDDYNAQLNAINQYQEQMELERQQRELQRQQWEREFAEQQRQFNVTTSNKYNINGGGFTDSSFDDDESNFGNSAETRALKDYYFKNTTGGADYQPRYINNAKLVKTGAKMEDIGTLTDKSGNKINIKGDKNIWQANGRYYVWYKNNYIDVTDYYKQALNVRESQGGSGF